MTEGKLLQRLRKRKLDALLYLVKEHGDDLLIFAYTILNDPDRAFVMVYDVLLTLWDRGFPDARAPLHTYLYDRLRAAARPSGA